MCLLDNPFKCTCTIKLLPPPLTPKPWFLSFCKIYSSFSPSYRHYSFFSSLFSLVLVLYSISCPHPILVMHSTLFCILYSLLLLSYSILCFLVSILLLYPVFSLDLMILFYPVFFLVIILF